MGYVKLIRAALCSYHRKEITKLTAQRIRSEGSAYYQGTKLARQQKEASL